MHVRKAVSGMPFHVMKPGERARSVPRGSRTGRHRCLARLEEARRPSLRYTVAEFRAFPKGFQDGGFDGLGVPRNPTRGQLP
jgi:hypothetical protein